MRYIVAVLSIALLFQLQPTSYLKKQPTSYSEASSLYNHDTNECFGTGELFKDVRIKIEYLDEKGEFLGRWKSDTNTIILVKGVGTDIDTIAHEVSHLVDTLMERYKVRDEHFEAYLQGSFTECVWTVVNKDTQQ